MLQLALQLPHRHDHAHHDRSHRLGYVSLLRYRQRLLPPLHLPLLPRDGAPLTQGDRHHLCERLR